MDQLGCPDGGSHCPPLDREPKGAPVDVFTSFETGTLRADEGGFEAPFEGVHGWYWKNKTSEPITVELQTAGVYADISRK